MLGKIGGRRRRGQQRMRWLDGITDSMGEFEESPAVGDGQGGLACCSPQGCKEPGTTEWLNNSSGTDTQTQKSLWRWREKTAVCQEGWETAEGPLCPHLDLTLLASRLWDTHSLLFKPPRRWDSDDGPSSWMRSPSARDGYMKTWLRRKQNTNHSNCKRWRSQQHGAQWMDSPQGLGSSHGDLTPDRHPRGQKSLVRHPIQGEAWALQDKETCSFGCD